jgi:hypothetical protein
LALAKFGAAVSQVLAAEDASARIRSASGQAQSTGRTARPSARSTRSDSRAASGPLLEGTTRIKRPDKTRRSLHEAASTFALKNATDQTEQILPTTVRMMAREVKFVTDSPRAP